MWLLIRQLWPCGCLIKVTFGSSISSVDMHPVWKYQETTNSSKLYSWQYKTDLYPKFSTASFPTSIPKNVAIWICLIRLFGGNLSFMGLLKHSYLLDATSYYTMKSQRRAMHHFAYPKSWWKVQSLCLYFSLRELICRQTYREGESSSTFCDSMM